MLVKQKEPSHMFVVKLGMVSNLTLNIQVSNCHVYRLQQSPDPLSNPRWGFMQYPVHALQKKTTGWLTIL